MDERGENKEAMGNLIKTLLQVFCKEGDLNLGHITEEDNRDTKEEVAIAIANEKRFVKEKAGERKKRGEQGTEGTEGMEKMKKEEERIEIERNKKTKIEQKMAEDDRPYKKIEKEATHLSESQVKQWTPGDVANWITSLSLSKKNPIHFFLL